MAAYRILRPDDARTLAMLHARGIENPWSPASFRAELSKSSVLGLGMISALQTDQMISFIVFQRVLETAEILTLVTEPDHRRQGVATAVLSAGLDHLRERGVTRCELDVAADNVAAIQFYQRIGFSEDGRRSQYYKRQAQGRVDAVLMSLDMSGH